MSVVWVVKDVKGLAKAQIDVSQVAKFGAITPVFGKEVSPLDMWQMRKIVKEQVIPAAFKDNYLLVAGPSIMQLAFACEWLGHFKELRLLAYKYSTREYVVKKLQLPNRQKDTNGKVEETDDRG